MTMPDQGVQAVEDPPACSPCSASIVQAANPDPRPNPNPNPNPNLNPSPNPNPNPNLNPSPNPSRRRRASLGLTQPGVAWHGWLSPDLGATRPNPSPSTTRLGRRC